jgi:hypothetical protein
MGVTKFSKEQIKSLIDMYVLNKYSISKIKNECGFSICGANIYYHLKKNNISLIRKSGTKHDLVGKIFGYLTVLKMAQTEKSGKLHMWRAICKCSNCGNQNFDVNPQSLLRGATTSCGCSKDRYVKTTGKNSVQYTGYEGLNGAYWGKIKLRAQRRGYSICVDIKYAWDLYLKQNKKCALSGLPIEFAISSKKSSATSASLDRIDSNKGYVEGNIQWVHKHINIMKNVFEQNYFISLCKLIAANNNVDMSKINNNILCFNQNINKNYE